MAKGFSKNFARTKTPPRGLFQRCSKQQQNISQSKPTSALFAKNMAGELKFKNGINMTKMVAARVLNMPAGEVVRRGETISLENVIKQCVQTKASWGLKQNDIAFALAFWSMIECGFQSIPREEAKKLQDKNHENLPRGWKHKTRHVYEAHFYLPPHSDYPVKLVALPAGDILCINILASNVSPKNINLKSLAIYTPGYVPRPEDDPVSRKFSGLHDFQLLLKNLIIWPIRCSILTDQGIPNGSLCGLSDEIKLRILRHLSAPELLTLGQTCHSLNRVCNDQGLWKEIFHGHFKSLCKCSGDLDKCGEDVDWKDHFKQAYEQRQREESTDRTPSGSYHTPPEAPYGSETDFEID